MKIFLKLMISPLSQVNIIYFIDFLGLELEVFVANLENVFQDNKWFILEENETEEVILSKL